MNDDPELRILESVYSNQKNDRHVRQRDIAHASGASLGMTNTILKRLAQKGLIIVQRINSRNIRYVITPSGINEIVRRSYRYLKRTVESISIWRDLVDGAVTKAKQRGFTHIRLEGTSELAFLVEYSCVRHGLQFSTASPVPQWGHQEGERVLTLHAESCVPPDDVAPRGEFDHAYLHAILHEPTT